MWASTNVWGRLVANASYVLLHVPALLVVTSKHSSLGCGAMGAAEAATSDNDPFTSASESALALAGASRLVRASSSSSCYSTSAIAVYVACLLVANVLYFVTSWSSPGIVRKLPVEQPRGGAQRDALRARDDDAHDDHGNDSNVLSHDEQLTTPSSPSSSSSSSPSSIELTIRPDPTASPDRDNNNDGHHMPPSPSESSSLQSQQAPPLIVAPSQAHANDRLLPLASSSSPSSHHTVTQLRALARNHRYCTVCDLVRPPRARHCRDCHVCVVKFDHHCPFFGNCIGAANHRWFVLFLYVQVAVVVWSLDLSVETYVGPLLEWEWYMHLMVTLILSLCLVTGISLLGFHTYLALTNQTTYHLIEMQRASAHAARVRRRLRSWLPRTRVEHNPETGLFERVPVHEEEEAVVDGGRGHERIREVAMEVGDEEGEGEGENEEEDEGDDDDDERTEQADRDEEMAIYLERKALHTWTYHEGFLANCGMFLQGWTPLHHRFALPTPAVRA